MLVSGITDAVVIKKPELGDSMETRNAPGSEIRNQCLFIGSNNDNGDPEKIIRQSSNMKYQRFRSINNLIVSQYHWVRRRAGKRQAVIAWGSNRVGRAEVGGSRSVSRN
jgi:hypothetical protein